MNRVFRSFFTLLAAITCLIGNSGKAQTIVENLSSQPTGKIHFSSMTPRSYFQLIRRPTEVAKTPIWGTLHFPEGATTPVAAMVVSHGSGGILSNVTQRWTPLLLSLGLAVFVVDSYGPRGIADTVSNQNQLSFAVSVADAFSALKLLATDPRIDPKRIGEIGFSRGGSVALNTMVERLRKAVIQEGDVKFAAHIAFYPACDYAFWGENTSFTNAPVMFAMGEKDDYVSTNLCVNYAEKLKTVLPKVDVKVYKDAHHDFDAMYVSRTWIPNAVSNIRCAGVHVEATTLGITDLGSNTKYPGWDEYSASVKPCMSRGGTIESHPKAASSAEADVREFLRDTLRLSR